MSKCGQQSSLSRSSTSITKPRGIDKFSYKLIKHCYEHGYEIPPKAFLSDLDMFSEGNYFGEEEFEEEVFEEDEATQVYSEEDVTECSMVQEHHENPQK